MWKMKEKLSLASVAQPVQRIPKTERREAEEQSVYAQIVDPRLQERFEIQRLREAEEQSVYAQIVDPRRQERLEIQRLREAEEQSVYAQIVDPRRHERLEIQPLRDEIQRVSPPRRTQEPIQVKTRGQPPIRAPGEVGESRPRPLPKRRTPSPPRLNRGHSRKTRDYRSPERFPPREAVQGTKRRKIAYTGPFTKWIAETPPNPKMELPKFVIYDGKSRAYEHICHFKILMDLITNDEALFCKAFPISLRGMAINWFLSLKPNSIDSWEALENMFLDRFSIAGLL